MAADASGPAIVDVNACNGYDANAAYDTKIERKRAVASAEGIELVELYPDDLLEWERARIHLAVRLGLSNR